MSRTVPAARRVRRHTLSSVRFPFRWALPRVSPRLLVGLGALPVLVLASVALFELANWDKVTPGVTALGTSVGGLSRTEAVAELTPSVQQLLDRPLDIRAASDAGSDADQTWHTTARDLGLRLDPNELVDAAYQVGRQGNPFGRLGDQLGTLFHGRSVSPSSTTDRAALDTSLTGMAQQVNRSATDAHLSLAKDGSVQATPAQAGLAVDVDASRDQLTAALNSGAQSVNLVINPVAPAIPDQQLQDAHDQLDQLIGSSAEPLTATFADQSWQLDRSDLIKSVSLSGGTQPGEPAAIKIDDAPIQAWAAKIAGDVDQPVQNARFAFNGGNLKALQPSKEGRTLDQAATVTAVHAALLAGDQTVTLPVSTVEPTVSSDDPQSLGITELIDRGSTSYAGSVAAKAHNIQLAAQRLNGIVVPAGATFSFNDSVGPTTIDAGFQWGFGIESGDDGPLTVPSVAGGICQVATTLFQPVFWSGYQLEERYWHLYWIPAYTSHNVVGLDVTVDSDAGLDFKWTNTTKDNILIQADTDDSNIYFGLYGKKPNWNVQVDDAIITNKTPADPKPIAQEDPTMPWGQSLLVETARDGFDAEVVRHVTPTDGGDPRTLDLKSTYQPARTITLVGSKGKPASASVDDAMQKVLDAQKPADAKPAATVVPTVTADQANGIAPAPQSATANQPKPTAAPVKATATAAPAVPTATPAPKPQAPAPTAKPQVTVKPATSNPPTPVPSH